VRHCGCSALSVTGRLSATSSLFRLDPCEDVKHLFSSPGGLAEVAETARKLISVERLEQQNHKALNGRSRLVGIPPIVHGYCSH
jgi:hypothetical protein